MLDENCNMIYNNNRDFIMPRSQRDAFGRIPPIHHESAESRPRPINYVGPTARNVRFCRNTIM